MRLSFAILVLLFSSVNAQLSWHNDYGSMLTRYVDKQGLVDYAGLKSDRGALDRYVLALAATKPQQYDALSEAEQIAFWINAYNALTLVLIIDHYPIVSRIHEAPLNSIRQIPGAWDKIRFTVMGEQLTLNEIEHQRLRKHFSEPRIHMALVCAARSCPRLRTEPYRGADLATQLSEQSRLFLSDPANFSVDAKAGVVRLSSIFTWFPEDFGGRDGVLAFVRTYSEVSPKIEDMTIEYVDYDWTLNEQPIYQK